MHKENGLIIEVHRVNRNPESKLESQKYDVELPFIVNGKQVISLNEPLERLEEI